LEALEIATPRPSLSNRAAYRLAGGVIGLGIFGSVVAAIGLVVAFEAWRQRPGSHLHSTEPKEAQLEQAS
jgi:hypothetical protein